MGKPKAPRAPDPVATGAAQTSTNIATAIANQLGNMTNQVTPYGTKSYDQSGTFVFTDPNSGKVYNLPRFTETTALTADGQYLQNKTVQTQKNLADMAVNQSGRLGALLSRPMDMSGVVDRTAVPTMQQIGNGPNFQSSIAGAGGVQRVGQNGVNLQNSLGDAGKVTNTFGADWSQDRQRVEDALMSRLAPQQAQDRAALENQLAQQGITKGSEAYDREMSRMSQSNTDARMQAILAGGQEQSRLASLAQAQAQFQNQAQQQQFDQLLGRGNFTNQSRLGEWQSQLQAQQGNNAAQQQQFAQNAAQGAFRNQALQQGYQNRVGATQANNASAMQAWQANEAARAAGLNEAVQLRNQPINEIMAMQSGAQVQSPTFGNTPGLNMPTTDYAGLIQQNYANQMGAYNSQMNSWNGMWGGLLGLGGNILSGGFA